MSIVYNGDVQESYPAQIKIVFVNFSCKKIKASAKVMMAWGMVFLTHTQSGLSEISRKSWVFLILSGLATGASWLCYYRALQMGEASKVVPIDKLSVVITTTTVLIAVARLEFTPSIPILASIEVSDANIADSSANINYINFISVSRLQICGFFIKNYTIHKINRHSFLYLFHIL